MTSERKQLGWQILHHEATDSTNNRAAELAHSSTSHGTVITAGVQTQGRGQHGRTWHSAPGCNVLMSVLLFPPPELRRPAILTAYAGVVVAETLLQLSGQQAKLKWPNDVLIRGKKICGILCECGIATSTSEPHFIVGIGLNVNQTLEDFAQQQLPDATSLALTVGRTLAVKSVTETLVQNLATEYEQLLNGELEELEACWKWRIGLLGKPVTLELMDSSIRQGRLLEMTFNSIELETTAGRECWKPEEIRHVR